jgi:glycosyltransferase 2 family protein
VMMAIPISIGGLGIREGGFVLLLGQADIDAADATLLSLLTVAAVLVASAAIAAGSAAIDALRPPEPATGTAPEA